MLIFKLLCVGWLVIPLTVRAKDPLLSIIEEKEQTVHKLVNAVSGAYLNRCSHSCLNNSKKCIVSACGSKNSHSNTTVCSKLYGNTSVSYGDCEFSCSSRRLDFGISSVFIPSPNKNQSRLVENCWTSALNYQFREIHLEDSKNTLRWQYFATTSGIVRIFPAITQLECFSFDPRIRPWYVAATSGPKNVMLVLDTSASMLNYGRLKLARQAAITVVETLTNVDFVAVVLFSDVADQLLAANQTEGSLLQGTYENINILTEILLGINAKQFGGTNFEAALNKAFDILESVTSDNSANCHTAILFLTDGLPNKGITSQESLISLVEQRNTHNARIFTYTFGSLSGASLARGIACATSGVYAHINDHGNLREQMSQYYDYFAAIKTASSNEVTWVEPYQDAVGAGLLVTASKAVYTNSSPQYLIGVVGVDVLVKDLENAAKNAGLNHTQLIHKLAMQNTCPMLSNFTSCELNAIRVKGNGETCSDGQVCDSFPEEESCPVDLNISYCDYVEQRFLNDAQLYREESCCLHDEEDYKYLTPTQCRNTCTTMHTTSSLLIVLLALFFIH